MIDPDGKVKFVYPDVDASTHFNQVLRDLGGNPPKEGLLKRFFRR